MGSEGSDHGHERTAVPLVPDDLPARRHLDGTAGLEDRQRGVQPAEQALPGRRSRRGGRTGPGRSRGAGRGSARRPPAPPWPGPRSPAWRGWRRTARDRSRGVVDEDHRPAPRESASIPMAPLPGEEVGDRHPVEVDQAPEDVEDRLAHPVRGRAGWPSRPEPAGAGPGSCRRSHARPQVTGGRRHDRSSWRPPTSRQTGRARARRAPRQPASALEQEGGLVLARRRAGPRRRDGGAAVERRVLGEQRLRHPPGRVDEGPVAPAQRRQLQVAAALLARAEDRALAPQLEVDLGQLEAVVAAARGPRGASRASGVEAPENR